MVRLSKRRVHIDKITSMVKLRLRTRVEVNKIKAYSLKKYRREREDIGFLDEVEDEIDERILLLYRLKKAEVRSKKCISLYKS